MKNSLLALALTTVFVLGCGLDRLVSRSDNGAAANANTAVVTNTSATAPARPSMNDVDFAKDALTRLTEGDMASADMIDWENFKVMGQDAGQMYRTAQDEAYKAGFRSAFISSFSKSFKEKGGDLSRVKWKEKSRGGDGTVVAASAPGGSGNLLITVTRPGGVQKVSNIEQSR